MDQTTLLTVLIVFVALAAVAMLIQAITLIGLFFVARDFRTKLLAVWPDVEAVVNITRRTLEATEKHIDKIGAASGAILDITKEQFAKVDELLTDAATRAKVQMERAEMVLDDSMARVQETVSVLQSSVLRPIREVYGILSGFRTALSYLGRGHRPTVDHATSDEEMFI